jgi:Restriction endonuclease
LCGNLEIKLSTEANKMAKISKATVSKILKRADAAKTMPAKGKAFEDLACYIFCKIPGITCTKRNTLNPFVSEEIDVGFWNERELSRLGFLPYVILVECKNWSNPVGCPEVDWFISKLRRRSLDFGLLMAANGITGDKTDIQAAQEIVRSALNDGIRIAVITRAEIERLQTSENLVTLVKEKLCELAVHGTVLLV